MFKNFFQPKTPKLFEGNDKSGHGPVSVDGVTITGDGTPGNPLIGQSGSLPYLIYTANLTQTGTNAPVATVGQNTLGGTLVWTRMGAGDYRATLAGAFPNINKVQIMVQGMFFDPTFTFPCYCLYGVENANSIVLYSTTLAAGPNADDLLYQTTIEIRVYP